MLETEEKKLHITNVRVKSEHKKDFVNWQTKLNAVIASFPGFVSLEILALADAWTIIQRFSTEETYQAWKDSPQYKALFDELANLLQNDPEAIKESTNNSVTSKGESVVTEVFVTKVNPDQEVAYRDWIAKIHQIEATFPGFRGMYVQSPSKANSNWITFLQFDSPANLDYWLNSKERQSVLSEAKPLIASLESHRVFSPYAGWFGSLQKEGGVIPPAWKQSMIVLLVLYPIVMLEIWYLSKLTGGLPMPVHNFIGNALSVAFLAWPAVPLAIKGLKWWLETKDWRVNLLGFGLILALYLIEVLFFLSF